MSLKQSVQELITVFRYVFNNDKKILHSINESYEEVLLEDLENIPHDALSYVETYVNIVKRAYMCFDMVKFNVMLELIDASAFPQFSLNSYELFQKGVNKLSISADNKARIMNLTRKFIPLFNCIDKFVNNFRQNIKKLADRDNAASVLDDII
jgi:hypothetical protein